MITNKGIKISPNYHQKDWYDLNLSNNNMNNWNIAILIFKDRIEGRYFKQIQALDENNDRKIGLYSGFAIMSLTSLLIETLEQFWNGNLQTSRKSKTLIKTKWWINIFKKKCEISNDAVTYFNFFQRSDNLKFFFDTKEKADVFYSKIRCGLLHQGQTKGKSLIHVRKDEPMLKWINEDNIQEGISIHRRLFLDEVKLIYEKYITELQDINNLNFRRKTLQKKMKYIVEQK